MSDDWRDQAAARILMETYDQLAELKAKYDDAWKEGFKVGYAAGHSDGIHEWNPSVDSI